MSAEAREVNAAVITGAARRTGLEVAKLLGAAIANIVSINGMIGIGRASAYGVAKAGSISLTRSIAVEHAVDGIRCNAMAPAWTETRLLDGLSDAERERRIERIPQRRFAGVREVAAAVVFLGTSASSYVNGHMIPADGGYLALGAA